jgi:SAM-dependent methyltransferase
MAKTTPTYDHDFFEMIRQGSAMSARLVVPMIVDLFKPNSVLDAGCGVGTWLAEFDRNGVRDYLGIDGDYVDVSQLSIPEKRFRPTDLRRRFNVGSFDLTCSLEVAEHLPASSADDFVASLVASSPIVVFSAAIPYQGGVDHINEQWPTYWAQKFKANGYAVFDPLRAAIKNNRGIEVWYRQNILVYCRPDAAPPTMSESPLEDLDFVHPEFYQSIVSQALNAVPSGRKSMQGLIVAARRRLNF